MFQKDRGQVSLLLKLYKGKYTFDHLLWFIKRYVEEEPAGHVYMMDFLYHCAAGNPIYQDIQDEPDEEHKRLGLELLSAMVPYNENRVRDIARTICPEETYSVLLHVHYNKPIVDVEAYHAFYSSVLNRTDGEE